MESWTLMVVRFVVVVVAEVGVVVGALGKRDDPAVTYYWPQSNSMVGPDLHQEIGPQTYLRP
jgi:hypothetical protein